MTWRPYCHVHDFSRIIERVLLIDKKIIDRQVFNAGLNSNNSRKIDIAKKIQKKIKKLKIIKVTGTQDPRDYRVSFKKLYKVLNIKPRLTINDGIIEIIKSLKKGKNNSRDNGNFVIRKSI
jgi:nucleoside-diphosphate-sugar epimerase